MFLDRWSTPRRTAPASALRPGLRRERRADGPAGHPSRRARPPADRPGRGPARAQHHQRADLRLPARPRARRAPVRRAARGPRRLRVGRRRTGHRRPAVPRRAAHRTRHRQQRDDHRRPARPARARPVRAGRPRAVLLRRLRLGRPVLAPAHRDRPAQQGDRRPGGPRAPGPPRRAGPARPDRAAPLHLRPPHLVRLPDSADARAPQSSQPQFPVPRKEPSRDRRRR